VSLWAAVAEHRFFELMTERKNGGKSRGRLVPSGDAPVVTPSAL